VVDETDVREVTNSGAMIDCIGTIIAAMITRKTSR